MAGYSGTPLVKKLGIKDGFTVRFVHAPEHLQDLIGPLPTGVTESQVGCDFIHAFYTERSTFEADVSGFLDAINRDGMIWISWPKKASRVPTDMTEDVVRTVALPLGLVDVKVCAVDDVWSGLKLVIRKELR